MYGLLRWQASEFDATEAYSIVELGVVLLAFELGAVFGRGREAVLDFVRFVVVLLGMAILLFLNSRNFDDTEMWVLIGFPVVVASFEGARTWFLSTFDLTSTVPRELNLPEIINRVAALYDELSPRTRSLIVFSVGAVLGPIIGLSSSSVLGTLPQENKPALMAERDPVEQIANEPDPNRRHEMLDRLSQRMADVRLLQPTGARTTADGRSQP